jgi:bacterial/archaeal transporter family-2 protein
LPDPKFLLFATVGVFTGAILAAASVFNAALAQRVGTLTSMVVLTLIGATAMLPILLVFPSAAHFRNLPAPSHWYLYLGGFLGLAVLGLLILLVPRIGAATTLVLIVAGQLLMALLLDHLGFLGTPKIALNSTRLLGVLFAAIGAFLVAK